VLGNHDNPRIASRVGRAQARVAAMLLLTLRGTPTIYYGEEIGMTQMAIAADRVRDPIERNLPGFGIGRDGARTPMQWNDGPFAGFSSAPPWLPLADDFADVNVASQERDATSILALYRRLIALRRSSPALQLGSYRPVLGNAELLSFVRQHGAERVLVLLNLGADPISVNFGASGVIGRVLVSAFADRDGETVASRIGLRGNEGLTIALEADVQIELTITSNQAVVPG
jgi:alpha-glucosidase